MPEGRREQNKREAREAILEAIATHVAARGLFDFSVPEVARMAGMSHRTVYNYFPNRQALIDAFADWANDRMNELADHPRLDDVSDLPHAARRYFEAFSQMPGIATAYARIDAGAPDALVPADYRERRATFRHLFRAEVPDATPSQVDALAGLAANIGSSRTWYRLVVDHGLDGAQAGATASWLMAMLVDAVRRGELPDLPETTSSGTPVSTGAGGSGGDR